MSYEDRDPYGMYKAAAGDAIGTERRHGPGPELMGAGTLMGNEIGRASCRERVLYTV